MNAIIFTNPSARAGYDTRSIFKQSLTGLNSEFSFSLTCCLTKAEEPSLRYYLPIAGGRIIGFMPFLRVLVLCEMQSDSSKFWTHVAMSISYDDNHYATGTSKKVSAIVWLEFRFAYYGVTVQHVSHRDSPYIMSHISLSRSLFKWPRRLICPKTNSLSLIYIYIYIYIYITYYLP